MANSDLNKFREEVRIWLENCFPGNLAGKADSMMEASLDGGSFEEEVEGWRKLLAEKGWGAPTWPKEYGGAGLSQQEARVISQEMGKIGAFNPIPMLAGMGVTMVGPTMLEYGTEDQKKRHLPGIASGEIRWCLGLSEPNAGSDLASLTTKAEDNGDCWLINGQKIWTSGADKSQWCGALVRTDPGVKKHDGISFLMLPMAQAGLSTRPIRLIAGASPFCETFFNNARAEKDDMLGGLNEGWGVIKRLLQHERQSQTSARGASSASEPLQDIAKRYVGSDAEGRLADPDLRTRLVNHLMDAKAHNLTISRITAESKGNVEVTATTSILKNSATTVAQTRAELMVEMMGGQGVGWEGEAFKQEELSQVRSWLSGKAISIYGGSYEVQKNIISKNILGLPETTQKN